MIKLKNILNENKSVVNENLSDKIKNLELGQKYTLSSAVNFLGMVPTTLTPKNIHLIKQPVVDKLMKLYNSKKFFSKQGYDKFTPVAKALGESVSEESIVEEGYSTEEKRIVMMAVKKIAKYMNRDLGTALRYVIGAAEELQRSGKVK